MGSLESVAVVDDPQDDAVAVAPDVERNLSGIAVARDVGQAFLGDAVRRLAISGRGRFCGGIDC
jgi:hypothetical protein